MGWDVCVPCSLLPPCQQGISSRVCFALQLLRGFGFVADLQVRERKGGREGGREARVHKHTLTDADREGEGRVTMMPVGRGRGDRERDCGEERHTHGD